MNSNSDSPASISSPQHEKHTRRSMLKQSLATGAAVALGVPSLNRTAMAKEAETTKTQIACFTKSFQDWTTPEICQRFKQIGLDGLDFTVRSNGIIKPDKDNVAEELKKAALAAEEHEQKILFLTTDITETGDRAENVLAATQAIGVTKIKLGYMRYTGFGTLQKQIDDVKKRLAKISSLCNKYDILPCVHIHSGPYIPSHGTMLYDLLRDFDPQQIGAYVDPLHMALEGARDGWRQGLDLLAPWIALCSVKNFQFKAAGRDKHGQQVWKNFNCPVADGIAPIPKFIQALKQTGYNGIYSMHSEYKGSHSFRNLNTEECLKQTAVDLEFFRKLL